MRALLALAVAGFLALPALASTQTVIGAYTVNPGSGVVRLVAAASAGVGGVAFATHSHDTTVSVGVWDAAAGPVHALVCQDLNNDHVCNVTVGSQDLWACAWGGFLVGFPVQSASGSGKLLLVLVAGVGQTLEGCNVAGSATAGTVSVTFS